MENANGFIIGVFVRKHKILSFIEELRYQHKVKLGKVFVFTMDGNPHEYFVTFPSREKAPYVNTIRNASSFHVKNHCIFSINALNKLIESEKPRGMNNKDYTVNWDTYKGKLLTLHDGNLSIVTLQKAEDWTTFFN